MRVDVELLTFEHRRPPSGAEPFVLRDVSFTVDRGGHMVLFGPSGSGKTTLLCLVAGFFTPREGTIRFDGRPVSTASYRLAPRRRRIGMVFQGLALWSHLSVRNHVDLVLRARGVGRRERRRRAESLLEDVGLRERAGDPPGVLSGGEARRLALARALAAEPRLLLLDEPLAGLDRELRERVLELLSAMRRQTGLTTIHVTHDPEEVAVVGSRAAVLERGRVLQEGLLEDLYRRPLTPAAARLGGTVNLVDGVAIDSRRLRLPFGEFQLAPAARPGDRITAVVRPEHVELRPAASGPWQVQEVLLREGGFEIDLRRRGARLIARVGAGEPIPERGSRFDLSLREPVWGFSSPGPEERPEGEDADPVNACKEAPPTA